MSTLHDELRAILAIPNQRARAAALAALRDDFGAAEVDAALAALLDEASPPAVRAEQHATYGGQIINSPQTIVQGDLHNHADAATAAQQRALTNYLRSLHNTCRPLRLDLLDAGDTPDASAMHLEQVYINLRVRGAGLLVPLRSETGTFSVLTALQSGERHLMLLGGPGSGKSTFINHLVLCLAGARLGDASWLARLPEWHLGGLLPVRVLLPELAAFAPAGPGPLDDLLTFLRHQLGAQAEALAPIEAALTDGAAMLLFDGLDEVAGDAALARVLACVAAAAEQYPNCPILVACRELDYQDNPKRRVRGFATATLTPLDDDQIASFIDAWYAERAATGRQSIGTAPALARAVQERPELRELAGQPLLLTMIALVHAGKGELPDHRALLYAECIDLLLLRWRQAPDTPDLLAQLDLRDFHVADLLALMARLGYAAHNLSVNAQLDDNAPTRLTDSQVRRELAQAFAPYAGGDAERRDMLVARLLHRIATRNGLLLKYSAEGAESYAFPHRSFQEFLAGYHLSRAPDYAVACAEHAATIQWHEALRLMVGYQVLKQDDLRSPPALVAELLARGPLEHILAGELLNLIGRARVASYRSYFAPGSGQWPRAEQALLRIATEGGSFGVQAPVRARAGLALGTLCYGALAELAHPRAHIPAPDQRLPFSVLGTPAQQGAWWQHALDDYWCPIEAGPFWHSDNEDDFQQIIVRQPYQIGRYTVTNAEFARFIADGGYADPQWWTPEGWKFLQPGGHPYDDQEQTIALPRYWHDAERNNPLQPVIGVSWYEAAAYCAWLTAQGHAQDWLPADDVIRLPSWAEWERAARGTDQRLYPWGAAQPTAEHANYSATGIGAPAPVGCFPLGRAECGAHDMAGNVYEWTATPDGGTEETDMQKDFTPSENVFISWGYFGYNEEYLRCGARVRNLPSDGVSFLGFRVVSPRARG